MKCLNCLSENLETTNGGVLCTDCGYHTHESYKGEEFLEKQWDIITKFARVADNGQYWIPIIMDLEICAIYPAENEEGVMLYAVAPFVFDEDGEKKMSQEHEEIFPTFKELIENL